MDKTKIFQVGEFCFSISYPAELIPPDNFMIFEVPQGQPTYFYTISLTSQIQRPDKTAAARREDVLIYSSGGLESRLIGTKGKSDFYASYQETGDDDTEIRLLSDRIQDMHFDTIFTSLLALERRMIEHNSLILHCAYMVYQGKAILFSAPSGTGKSTQAELWERYRGSMTINGDRALLRKINGIWTACAWPVCGSSGICKSGDFPIHAIVMLKQGETNDVKRLSPIQAFTQLYAQVTINRWNRAFVQRAMELMENLIDTVPVYQLTCNITEDAVSCLEHVLFPEPHPVGDGRVYEE